MQKKNNTSDLKQSNTYRVENPGAGLGQARRHNFRRKPIKMIVGCFS